MTSRPFAYNLFFSLGNLAIFSLVMIEERIHESLSISLQEVSKMSHSQKIDTLATDGAAMGDALVGIEKRNRGLKLITLSDIDVGCSGRDWCNYTPVKLVSSPKAGTSNYAHHIEYFLGSEFNPALKLHQSVLELLNNDLRKHGKEKKKYLHFLNGHALRVVKAKTIEVTSLQPASATKEYSKEIMKTGNSIRPILVTHSRSTKTIDKPLDDLTYFLMLVFTGLSIVIGLNYGLGWGVSAFILFLIIILPLQDRADQSKLSQEMRSKEKKENLRMQAACFIVWVIAVICWQIGLILGLWWGVGSIFGFIALYVVLEIVIASSNDDSSFDE